MTGVKYPYEGMLGLPRNLETLREEHEAKVQEVPQTSSCGCRGPPVPHRSWRKEARGHRGQRPSRLGRGRGLVQAEVDESVDEAVKNRRLFGWLVGVSPRNCSK